MQRYFAILFLSLLAACTGSDQTPAAKFQPRLITSKSAHSDSFNIAFKDLLAAYDSLRDQLAIEVDSNTINRTAYRLKQLIDSLPVMELVSIDTALTDTSSTYVLSLSSELMGFRGETSVVEKRKEFQLISEELYTLLNFAKYDRAIIYRYYSPEAFPDQGAYWLSESRDSKNPYVAGKGDGRQLKDSIAFGH